VSQGPEEVVHDAALWPLDALFSSASVGFGAVDTDLRCIRANAALAAMVGQPAEALLGRRPAALGGLFGRGLEELVRRVLERGEPLRDHELTGRLAPAPAGPRHWLVHAYPVRTDDGGTAGVGLVVVDITQRKANEVRLARLSALYEVLAELGTVAERCDGWPELFARGADILVRRGGFRMAWFGLLDERDGVVRPMAHAGFDEGYLRAIDVRLPPDERGRGPTGEAVRRAAPAVVDDIANDERMQPWRSAALRRGYRAVAAFPLHLGGNPVGALTVYSATARSFDDEGLGLVADVATAVSTGMESIDRQHRRRGAEQALQQQRAFLDAVLHNLTDGVVACDADGRLTVFNRATEELHGRSLQPSEPTRWAEDFQILRPDGITAMPPDEVPLHRALHGETVRDVEAVVRGRGGDRRVVVVNGQPLFDPDGRKLGAVIAMHDVTERKQAEARLTRQALHDALTRLPNRLLLLERLRHALARAERHPASVAVLFMDFDHFKVVNDSLGHQVGDQALIAAAERLHAAVRPGDTVARLGGDEFVVLCEDLASDAEATALSQRLQEVVAGSPLLVVDGTEVVMTASVGIAVAAPGDGPEDLLRNADTAMYRAKQRGRARHAVFDDSFRLHADGRLRTEHALRRALDDGRLRLRYQPIVDLREGRVVGAEALVRYEDPRGQLVLPEAFLDVAEDSGLIVPIGGWVLREACHQLRRWRAHPGGAHLRVTVNLSARQLAAPHLVEWVEQALDDAGLPRDALGVEVTEAALMASGSGALRLLERFGDAGPDLAIDDFGTGYSSLTSLRRSPVDSVKVDRSVVQGLGVDDEATAIVQAVVGLGRALGLATVAEGVETADQLRRLRALGCGFAQGFHFGRPEGPDALPTLLDARW